MTARVLLDACVLVPATTRALLIGLAGAQTYTPLWSPRIFAEWSHAAGRQGDHVASQTVIEQALLNARFPDASVTSDLPVVPPLPDANDTHVLAAAVAGKADELLTANTRDFPLRALAAQGLLRRHPDEWLLEMASRHPDLVTDLAKAAVPETHLMRKTLRKSGLNRLAKWLDARG